MSKARSIELGNVTRHSQGVNDMPTRGSFEACDEMSTRPERRVSDKQAGQSDDLGRKWSPGEVGGRRQWRMISMVPVDRWN
jgi:hypothetical protein